MKRYITPQAVMMVLIFAVCYFVVLWLVHLLFSTTGEEFLWKATAVQSLLYGVLIPAVLRWYGRKQALKLDLNVEQNEQPQFADAVMIKRLGKMDNGKLAITDSHVYYKSCKKKNQQSHNFKIDKANIETIEKINKLGGWEQSSFNLTLKNGEMIKISSDRREELINCLN